MVNEGMSDREAVERARSGDAMAREEIVNRCADMVFRIALRFTHDRHGAEDLSQKAFLKVFSSLDRFGPPWQLEAWIARIAYHVAIDQVRAARKEREGLAQYLDLGDANPVTPEEELLMKDCLRLILMTADAEPEPSCRETALLFFQQGKTVREIAAAQMISETAVTSRLTRFRGRLMKRLAAAALEPKP
jgi:RNA polymerase sigma-70 factor (ECF subfamily)